MFLLNSQVMLMLLVCGPYSKGPPESIGCEKALVLLAMYFFDSSNSPCQGIFPTQELNWGLLHCFPGGSEGKVSACADLGWREERQEGPTGTTAHT